MLSLYLGYLTILYSSCVICISTRVPHGNTRVMKGFTRIIVVVRKVAFIILSPSAIEASHLGVMRQFELFAIITPTYSTHAHCCMPSEW